LAALINHSKTKSQAFRYALDESTASNASQLSDTTADIKPRDERRQVHMLFEVKRTD